MVVKQKRRTIKKRNGKKVNKTQKGGWGRAASHLFRRKGRPQRIHQLTHYLHSRKMVPVKPKLTAASISRPYSNKDARLGSKLLGDVNYASRRLENTQFNRKYSEARKNFSHAASKFNNWEFNRSMFATKLITNAETQTKHNFSENSLKNIFKAAKNPGLSRPELISVINEAIKNDRKREANEKHGYIDVRPNN